MRTTITIPDDLLAEAQRISGKSSHSEAIVTLLREYLALRKRLELLEDLFQYETPHSLRQIKLMRRMRRSSS